MSDYLILSDLTKIYPSPKGPAVIVKNFNLSIKKGEFVCLIGHSGCGKSTVLSMVAGLNDITGGGIILAGKELVGPGPDRGVVFQSPCLLPWQTAFENVMLGINQVFFTAPKYEREQIAEYYLSVVGLGDSLHKRPGELSAGMRQRVGIARAFALSPKMLLLDEPFGMLDSLTRFELQQVLIELWRKDRKTALMVTHDVDEALFLSDRIVMMTNGPAAEVGDILEVKFPRPRNRKDVMEHPDYYRLREHLIQFLEAQSHQRKPEPEPEPRDPQPPSVPIDVALGNAANADLLPLPARHEWGEGRGEGISRKNGPPLPCPLLPRREERELKHKSSTSMMKQFRAVIATSALVLAATTAVYGGDYSPTSPLRPSAGVLNDWLRQDDPYMASWDFGVQTRLRYEIKENGGFVSGTPGVNDFRKKGVDNDNSYLLHRVKPRIGYTHEWFSVFVEGRMSGSTGDDRNPNPESDGPMDLHQAYVTVGNHKEFPLSLKVGRQELSYGDERLIGAFNWNNLGRVFDAAKLRWQNPWFGADFFASRVIIPDDNNFNVANDYDWFFGMYGSTKKIPKQTTEFYLLSRNTSAKSPTVNGVGLPALLNGPSARDIYTLGVRFKSTPGEFGNWDYIGEFMGQYGHFNDPLLPVASRSLEHRAYALFAGGGYTWTQAAWTPRVGLEYNLGSGDRNPNDGRHETFENLFPTNHKFYGYMDFFSLQNIHNLRLTSSVKPLPRLTLLADAHAFWLADTHDSLYTVAGARRGGLGTSPTGVPGQGYGINPTYNSYVGSEVDLIATYAVSPWATLELGYGHFFHGDYIRQTFSSPAFGSTDADYVYIQTNFNF